MSDYTITNLHDVEDIAPKSGVAENGTVRFPRETVGATDTGFGHLNLKPGKRHPFPELRAWFGCLYQVLLGQQEGPRFGQFIALYGIAETIALIETSLARPT